MTPDNVKMMPKNISSNQELIQEALDLGCTKAKIVLAQTISIANWLSFIVNSAALNMASY